MSSMGVFLAFVIRLLVFLIGVLSFSRPQMMTMSMPVIIDDVGLSVPYTVDELMAIVDVHNQQRGNVTPSAANMEYMHWDEELAAAADGWAVKCTLQHGKPENSTISRFGQNIWAGFGLSKWLLPETLGPFQAWNNEDRFYDYERNSCKEGRMCGHYTQIVWATTRAIGCGRAFCTQNENIPFDRWIVVCNYLPGGNIQGRQPYIAGPSCTRCSSGNGQCYKNKICRPCSEHTESCDCNLQCQNCGTLDRETCTCSCPKGWHGNECGKPCVDTHEYCGRSPGWPGRYYCPFASYIPRYCPLMCGVCEAEDPDFVCDEKSSDGGWQTTDGMTTEKIVDGIITDVTTSIDDITTDLTKSHKDISTTPFPMTTLDIDLVTQEILSTKSLDETPVEQTGEGFHNVITTPSTENPHWLEQLNREIIANGKQVNYAAKSIDTDFSNQLRSHIGNTSNVASKENVEISAENGMHIDRRVDSTATEVSEMEISPTAQIPEITSSVSSGSNETASASSAKDVGVAKTGTSEMRRPANAVRTESDMSTSKHANNTHPPALLNFQGETMTTEPQRTEDTDSNIHLSTEKPLRTSNNGVPQIQQYPVDTGKRTEDNEFITRTPGLTANSQQTTPPYSTVSVTISVDENLQEKPFSMTTSEGNREVDFQTSTDHSLENLRTSVTSPTAITSEVLMKTTASTTPVQSDPSTSTTNNVPPLGVTTESTSTTLDSKDNALQRKTEGVESITDVSEDLSNVPVLLGKRIEKELGVISEHLCRKTFTAVGAVGPTLFLFQGQHLWRVNVSSGQTFSEKETLQSYFGLDGQKVTAALYRQSLDVWMLFTYINVFFVRNQSHSQSEKTPEYYQTRITDLGIPFGVVVDAAFHDDRRKKLYLFTNRWVWRYDDGTGALDEGYPRRSHHEFSGLMRHRPSAAVTLNGTHYILYGKKYVTIDQDTHQVDERRGGNFLEEYLGCFSEHQ